MTLLSELGFYIGRDTLYILTAVLGLKPPQLIQLEKHIKILPD